MKLVDHIIARHHAQHPATAPANVALHESLTTNDHIAMFISDHVGTMQFCYILAGLMFCWSVVQMFLLPLGNLPRFDPYPFPFLFFCLGGIMQSLLMPLLMVANNLQSRHNELRAEAEFAIDQHNQAQIDVLEAKINAILARLPQ